MEVNSRLTISPGKKEFHTITHEDRDQQRMAEADDIVGYDTLS